MASNRREIDEILNEIKEKPQKTNLDRAENIDDEVNDILASLGIEPITRKQGNKQPLILEPANENTQTEKIQQEKAQTQLKQIEIATPKNKDKTQDNNTQQKPNNSQTVPKNEAESETPVLKAPLSQPFSKSETDTFELPNIKEYAEIEQKRAAQKARKEGEEKLLRMKEQEQQQQLLYAKKQAELQAKRQEELKAMKQKEQEAKLEQKKNAMGTQKQAELKAMQDTDEIVKTTNKQNIKRGINTMVKSSNVPNLKHLQNDPAFLQFFGSSAASEGMLGTKGKNAKNNLGNQKANNSDNKSKIGNNFSALSKNQMQDTIGTLPALSQETASFGAPLSHIVHSEKVNKNIAEKLEVSVKENAQINKKHETEEFVSEIIYNVKPSDTFRQNKLDVNSELFKQLAKPKAAKASLPAQQLQSEKIAIKSNIAANFENTGDSKSISKEIGIDAPLIQTATMGIDPDKYGIAPINYHESEDYNKLSDAPMIEKKLKKISLFNLICTLALGVLSIIVIALGFLKSSGAGNFTSGSFSIDASTLLTLNLLVLVGASALCHKIIISGFYGVFKHLSVDTLTLFALFGAFVQNIICLALPAQFTQQNITLFAPVAVLLLFFNYLGKLLFSKAVEGNFDIISKSDEHYAAFAVKNKQLTNMVCSGIKEHKPSLLVSRPTSLMRGFMRHSFSSTISDVYGRKFSIILLLMAIACAAVAALNKIEITYILSAFAGALCIGAPLSCTLVYAIPALKLQRSSAKYGAAVPGASAVQSLGLCNTVLLRSRDLFPSENVILHFIKPFEKKRIDLAVLYAASIVYENCETLADTFLNMVDNDTNALFEVTHAETEFNLGVTGNIDDKKIIFGNRDMMRRYQINMPSLEYERSFTDNGDKCAIYLAVNGELYSMFVVSYEPNKIAATTLKVLTHSGINALIYSNDFNISQKLITSVYHISPEMIKILSQSEKDMLTSQTEYIPESEGYMIHKNTIRSFIGGLRAASKASQREKLANTVEFAGVLFAMLIAIVLSFTGVLVSLSLYLVLIYQLAWCAITLLPITFKK